LIKSALFGKIIPTRDAVVVMCPFCAELQEAAHEAVTGSAAHTEAEEHVHGRATTAGDLAAEAVTELVESVCGDQPA
jgi:hypothetical protein